MTLEFSEKRLGQIKADFELAFVLGKNLKPHEADKATKELFALHKYTGEGSCLDLARRRIYVELKDLDYESIRLACFHAYKGLERLNVKSLKLPSILGECTVKSLACVAEGFIFGGYDFDKYKKEKKKRSLEKIIISAEELNAKTIKPDQARQGLALGQIIAGATNFAKDIVNTTAADYTPLNMAEDAQALAKNDKKIKCEIFDEKYLKKEGMEAFLAVNRASPFPPRLIHLSYKGKGSATRVVLVGKGLTYDSGGLSLKPTDSMITMKSDKGGAAAVLGIIKAAAELDLELELHGVIGSTENMLGGNSYKPGDVLSTREGVSVEVRNTDAEGRLVLADCLSFAQDLKPDLLIDLATLTGACVVGLGEYTNGILGNNEGLLNEFYLSSKTSGEYTNILHFNPYLRESLKSGVADISNISGGRYGGAINAGVFLDHFIRKDYKDKWIHLDIAGPAYLEKAWGYNAYGASGAGVRMCINFLLHLLRKAK